mgnify:FL=1
MEIKMTTLECTLMKTLLFRLKMLMQNQILGIQKKKIIINSREMDIINLNQKIRNLPLIGLLLSEILGKVNLESK